jgi:hypothetical protein
MYALGGTVIDNPSGAHAISPVLIIEMYFYLGGTESLCCII